MQALEQEMSGYRGSRAMRRANLGLRLSFLANYIQTLVFLLLKLGLKGTQNEAQFLKVKDKVSYCPRPPVHVESSVRA
jgi:hypothetical protein